MLYRERLLPGPTILALGVALFFMVGIAYSAAFESPLGILLGLSASALYVGFAFATAPQIRIEELGDEFRLTAGRATIGIKMIRSVNELTPFQRVEFHRGRHADTAFNITRGTLPVVALEITDPLDPHGLWCLSTRDPQALIQAIATASGPEKG